MYSNTKVIMKKPTIAFIDIVGLPYDGSTLSKRGLGGSETAVIQMAKELARLNFDVTVYNNTNGTDTAAGYYDGVLYKNIHEKEFIEQEYDVVVSSRTVFPFLPPGEKLPFEENQSDIYSSNHYTNIVKNAKWKALWLHDTFSHGEHVLENLLMDGYYDELFMLSDWHFTYILNCEHSEQKRNYEVLKRKSFITRNGMIPQDIEVDISQKDRNLFVYNASLTKGMEPLVLKCWPKIKKQIPNARLKIIGGFYEMKPGDPPDDQQVRWLELKQKYDGNLSIEFTGVITIPEVAEILKEATYFLYPAAFPETFGISTLEAQYYGCVPITCRFGALEETALELGSWKLNYAITPNILFSLIDEDAQVEKFVDLAVSAYNDPYLTQQKAHYCTAVKDIASWDTVAIQWKQHLFKKLGLYLPVEDYRKATKVTNRVHRLYDRRTNNTEEHVVDKQSQQHIYIVSPFYNSADYIDACIRSVASQDYENYTHILIDDNSTDSCSDIINATLESLSENRREKIRWCTNDENKGAVYNQIGAIRAQTTDPNGIIVLLDGDDSLVNDPTIFHSINNLYHDGAEFTYGSCWSLADNIPLVAQDYPKHIRETKSYRGHKFNWGLPYTHLRTFRRYLVDQLPDNVFKDTNGEWFRAGGDVAIFYNVIEQANPNNIVAVKDIWVNYNDKNPLNDYKVNAEEQTRNAEIARSNTPSNTKRILLAIPTAKNIEADTFKSIYDLDVPEGYEIDFQYFYGYNVEQVRNLIAHYAIHNGYDYLFSVDSDIVLPSDCLRKMIEHDKDIITGVYIQRIPNTHTIEVYGVTPTGGMAHIPYEEIEGAGLVEVAGCGFGCVLVKRDVLVGIEYPHFVYQSAIDHKDTVSEDVYFCMKARDNGFRVWVDASILCDHLGSTVFKV